MAKAKAPDPKAVTAALTAAERAEELAAERAVAVTVHIGDEAHTWRVGDTTVADIFALERDVGITMQVLLRRIAHPHDTVAAAVAVWLARRQAGEKVAWRSVSESMRIGDTVWMEEGDGDTPDPSGLVESG